MKNLLFFRAFQHGAFPGMSDEFLGAAFLALTLIAGWQLLKRKQS